MGTLTTWHQSPLWAIPYINPKIKATPNDHWISQLWVGRPWARWLTVDMLTYYVSNATIGVCLSNWWYTLFDSLYHHRFYLFSGHLACKCWSTNAWDIQARDQKDLRYLGTQSALIILHRPLWLASFELFLKRKYTIVGLEKPLLCLCN